jgi:hypothetical protein
VSTSTRRRTRHKTAPEPAAAPVKKKCVLCQNADESALEDFGHGGDADGYWMCADVEPCVDRARATAARLKAKTDAPEPETTDATGETAEVSR